MRGQRRVVTLARAASWSGLLVNERRGHSGLTADVASFAHEDVESCAAAGHVLDMLDRPRLDPRGQPPPQEGDDLESSGTLRVSAAGEDRRLRHVDALICRGEGARLRGSLMMASIAAIAFGLSRFFSTSSSERPT